MGYLINGYKIMGKEMAAYIVQHRSGIGTAISVGGTIVSNILSTKAGAKSARMIDAKENEIGRQLTNKEKLKLCWTNHIGSVGTAAISCVGAGYSHNQHVKDFNKVATAYAGVKKLYDSTRKATREVLGEKKALEVQDKVNQKYIEEHPEVKQKISECRVNPDPHTMQKYYEPVSGEVFFSSKDKIEMAITTMKAEMAALKPRSVSGVLERQDYGIKLRRFHELANPNISDEKLCAKVMNLGWNKGTGLNSDDDDIGVFYTPMLLNDDNESCIVINWDQEPSDMRYGDYLKA